jgi:Kef-type K+ transport system membrane component KefB
MRKVFAGLAIALALTVVAQFYLAASGAFDPAPADESFGSHRALGYGIVLFAVLLTIVAPLARMPGRLIGMTALVAGLGVAQVLIRVLADAVDDSGGSSTDAGQLVFGLHAINGLIMLALAAGVAWRGSALARRPVSAS